MLHNGIPILKALHIAKDSTGNRVLAAAIEKSAENVTAGQKLADPLRKCKLLPAGRGRDDRHRARNRTAWKRC